MSVNYNDKRFTNVEEDKEEALTDLEKTYGGMIENSESYYQDQIDAAQSWEQTQAKLQNEKTEFAIEQIEQQKGQLKSDYLKEQSAAYVDWQKQSNPYGVKAEQMAANGLKDSGYSEFSQVSMYNTYQNRVTAARESYTRAVLNYDNAIKDARMQNNAVLAQMAYQALQTELELTLQGFQYENTLLLDQAAKKMEVENMYYNRWRDVLSQINTENSLAEQQRQFNENMAFQREQFNWQKEQAAAKGTVKGNTTVKDKNDSSKDKNNSSKDNPSVSNTKSSTPKSYHKAAETMKKAGAIKEGDGGLMTKTEWKRRKAAGSNRAEFAYKTYEDYVNSFTAWRIENPE
jgi:hypothetical protein